MEKRYPVGLTPSCAVCVLRHDGDGALSASWSVTIGLRSGEATLRKGLGLVPDFVPELL
ncbi:MAG TPA: hypothetical protein VE984_01220 [Gaiellaceae bacterium]|nr:hypothetical protein [Gaiellaceae bacterium]